MAQLTALASHMLRGGRSTCLKLYTDQRRLLYGPMLQAIVPAAERDTGPGGGGGPGVAGGTHAVERKVSLWVRSVLGVLVVLIAERDTCGAVFGRQMGSKVSMRQWEGSVGGTTARAALQRYAVVAGFGKWWSEIARCSFPANSRALYGCVLLALMLDSAHWRRQLCASRCARWQECSRYCGA